MNYAISGTPEAVELLLNHSEALILLPDVIKYVDDDNNVCYSDGHIVVCAQTSLMLAAEAGQFHMCKSLIEVAGKRGQQNIDEFRDYIWATLEDSTSIYHGFNALQMALYNGWVGLATELFMILEEDIEVDDKYATKKKKKKEFNMLFAFASDLFTSSELDLIASRYVNVNEGEDGLISPLKNLINYAVRYDFHFDLLIQLIPRFPSPLSALGVAFPLYFKLLLTDARGCDLNILHRLVRLYTAVNNSISRHPLETTDLETYAERLIDAITCVVSNDTMCDPENVKLVLCHASRRHERDKFKDEIVQLAHAFRYGPLDHCVNEYVLGVFKSGKI